MSEKKRKFTTISIPTPLFKKIEKEIKGTGFSSVSSYVIFVLREILAKHETEEKKAFTKEDEERVKEKLRALGYLG